ncbi:MAG TPA: peroxiredoxin [Acidimicrobiales bacterium]|nr:peroxiredoxin [Acidimicrobiales bacterium]
MPVAVGAQAPEFELPASSGEKVALSGYRGDKNVVVVFYPFTFTGVCQGELCELRDDLSSFEAAGVQVLAVSCDSVHAQRKWAEEEGFGFPVLSDFWPHGEVAKAYGVFNDALGCADRHTFVIDKAGTVVATFASADLRTPREKAEYQSALATLSA